MAGAMRQIQPFVRNLFTKVTSPSTIRYYADAAESAKEMPLTFASANQVFYEGSDVKQVDIPGMNGRFGVLPKHVPLLSVLSPGVVTVFEKSGDVKKIFVSSGMVCVNDDSSVQILAEEAHPLEDIDVNAAKDSLQKAQSELASAPESEKEEANIAVQVAEAIVRAAS